MFRLTTISLTEALKRSGYDGRKNDFLGSGQFLIWCRTNVVLIRLIPGQLRKEHRIDYIQYLDQMIRSSFGDFSQFDDWNHFATQENNVNIANLVQEFGLRSTFFKETQGSNTRIDYSKETSDKRITIQEVYEAACVKLGYNGTLGSFKTYISHHYGSFAEYCVGKGYDVNECKWQNKKTAMRVAKMFSGKKEIQARAPGLYAYLKRQHLLNEFPI
jgi:hypothetical protein